MHLVHRLYERKRIGHITSAGAAHWPVSRRGRSVIEAAIRQGGPIHEIGAGPGRVDVSLVAPAVPRPARENSARSRSRRPAMPRCRASSSAASRCCIRTGSRKRARSSTRSSSRIRAARSRTGGWPSTTSGIRWRRRRRRKTSRRPRRGSTRRARSGPRPSASATGSRRSASTTATPTRCRSNARLVAYTKAMEQMTQRYPDDFEAWTYYALTLQASAPKNDKAYGNQLKSAEILERLFKQNPEHPGVAHYLVHAYDYPPLADKGIRIARAIRAHRAGRAACPAHAVTHLFDGGDVGGVHRLEPIGARGPARLSPRDGLHGLRPSPARPGRQGQGAGRSHRGASPTGVPHPRELHGGRRDPGTLRARARRLGRRRRAAGLLDRTRHGRLPDPLRPRSRHGAQRRSGRRATRGPRAAGAAQRTRASRASPIGPIAPRSRSLPSPPGWRTRRVRATRR